VEERTVVRAKIQTKGVKKKKKKKKEERETKWEMGEEALSPLPFELTFPSRWRIYRKGDGRLHERSGNH
jgi:hypothetical protein